jgi:ferredoxin
MQALLEKAAALGKGIFIMKALGGGHLYKEAETALTWVRDFPWVHSVAVGMQNQAELLYNHALFSGLQPDSQIQKRLAAHKRRLQVEFCSGCGKCIPKCPFGALYLEGGRVKIKEDKCMLCSYCATACEGFCLKVG